ncbi:MAG TPA: radical SAM protein [Planctomycetota bacterium]|nr:radical SAM protein [Planctomycetota bacterium]
MPTTWTPPVPADTEQHDPALVFEAGERNHHISNTAYPIAHNKTWGSYRVPKAQHLEAVKKSFDSIDDLCLYAHIPFCEVRCAFCEYTVVGRSELPLTKQYMGWLNRELGMYREWLNTTARTLHGFDIGGGTPSFVEAELIAELVENARRSFKWAPVSAISIETTPRIAAAEPTKIEAYTKAGIERISMGIQVIQPDLLKVLNRDGNGVEHHFKAVEHIRRAGFKKFNVDLMYGFYGQSLESWRATLEHAISLKPEYITLYRMRYKLTKISDQAPHVHMQQVREQAALAKKLLADAGFLANPGKNTYSSIPGDVGTSDYLKRRVIDGIPYLGIGLGSQSMTHTSISYNDGAVGKNLAPYQRSVEAGVPPVQDLYDLPIQHMMAKMIAVSFYFGEINYESFRNKFGIDVEAAFPAQIAWLKANGYMHDTGKCLSMTPEGAKHFNGVIAQFFAPSVQAYLIARDPANADDFDLNRKAALNVARAKSA